MTGFGHSQWAAASGRSATFESEREWFDHRRSQFDPLQPHAPLRSGRWILWKPPFRSWRMGLLAVAARCTPA